MKNCHVPHGAFESWTLNFELWIPSIIRWLLFKRIAKKSAINFCLIIHPQYITYYELLILKWEREKFANRPSYVVSLQYRTKKRDPPPAHPPSLRFPDCCASSQSPSMEGSRKCCRTWYSSPIVEAGKQSTREETGKRKGRDLGQPTKANLHRDLWNFEQKNLTTSVLRSVTLFLDGLYKGGSIN